MDGGGPFLYRQSASPCNAGSTSTGLRHSLPGTEYGGLTLARAGILAHLAV